MSIQTCKAAAALLLLGGVLASFVSLAPAQTAHDPTILVLRCARILPTSAPPIAQTRDPRHEIRADTRSATDEITAM